MAKKIIVKGAREHNLNSVDVEIPHDSLTVITGVSGSGKSSLAFDTICNEGQRLYLETLPSYSRLYSGKLSNAKVDQITGLRATISVDQHKTSGSFRSTVGTATELYDFLRLLFARIGTYEGSEKNVKIDRSLFSFNSPKGACPDCNGLGMKETISPELLIRDEQLSLREGALIPTTPTGYIVYSQVTLDVLNTICKEHGFDIDIPWKDLSKEEKNIIFYGSNQIKVPFGKHTLESRLKWSGITAKPREEGYYKGIINIMEDILKRDRNKNILRFTASIKCPSCDGERLNAIARAVKFNGKPITYFNKLSITELKEVIIKASLQGKNKVLDSIRETMQKKIDKLETLGLGYLELYRETSNLSGGEIQRIRLATQTGGDLSNILYVFDEPSIGLHNRDSVKLINLLKNIKKNGNTVCVVEHDRDIMREADKIIDIGPGAGINGGDILIQDIPKNLGKYAEKSKTASYLINKETIQIKKRAVIDDKWITISGARKFNLKNISVGFKQNAINVVTGVSGAGKSTLVKRTLAAFAKNYFEKEEYRENSFEKIEGLEFFTNMIEIDSSPIGRTPRSNPATYISLFELIREIYSSLPKAKEMTLKKSHFSFNVPGGRCESCQGAGVKSIGMFFMGNVKIPCDTCHGKRFKKDILEIKYKGKSIYDILELSFEEAAAFFTEPKILEIVNTVNGLGLSYIKLGQPATTLSGGEAQRVKLASRLSKKVKGNTLYLFDEPTIGLSDFDIQILMDSFVNLINNGHTLIIIEHNLDIIRSADHIIDLGPESGPSGGYLVASGNVSDIIKHKSSYTGIALKNALSQQTEKKEIKKKISEKKEISDIGYIEMTGISTNNLKNISVKIPKNKFTVVTGVSGSGKSSLVFDSLYNETHKRFIERLSIYARQLLKSLPPSEIGKISGLTPSIGIKQNIYRNNPRSTVGTVSGIYDLYRLLYSRCGISNPSDNSDNFPQYAENFSFNHSSGACPHCKGLGYILSADPSLLISQPELPFFDGAMDKHETGRFYGDKFGQYKPILFKAGEKNEIDFSRPVKTLSKKAINMALYGTGEIKYSAEWKFKRKNREGSLPIEKTWPGFVNLINEEYSRKSMQARGKKIRELMTELKCISCNGERLNKKSLEVKFLNLNISALSAISIKNTIDLFKRERTLLSKNPVSTILIDEALKKLEIIRNAGLSYLTLDRKVDSISHGEYRRLQLVVQMVNGLQDMTYILDEPTQGLHSRDISKLISLLDHLKKDNTIIAVEHDMDIINSADYIIDMGPGSGTEGGNIIASGTVEELIENPASITGKFLSEKKITNQTGDKSVLKPGFSLRNINLHNIKNLDQTFPVGGIIVLTGVSGSGKSSLLFKAVFQSLKNQKPVFCDAIEGNIGFNAIIKISQSAIGNTPLSNPATYTGIFDSIRTYYAKSENAVLKKLSKKHFAFNSKDGQCSLCKGMGKTKVSMDFLSDIWINCTECQGRRYKDEISACSVNGLSIDQVLDKTIDESKQYFETVPEIHSGLKLLTDIGLGYLKLGQGSNTLSGGEAQRLKIAKELILSSKKRGAKLFLMDEPTTGLHFEDVKVLMNVFRKLKHQGHTLIIIEHDLNIIANADWIIDMGPEGGDMGGKVIFEGTIDAIKKNDKSHTGTYLREYLK